MYTLDWGFPGGSVGKEPACNARDARDMGSIPGSGRSPGEEHGNPLQDSCLENAMDRGAWRAAVPGAAQSQTRLKQQHSTHSLSLGTITDVMMRKTLTGLSLMGS